VTGQRAAHRRIAINLCEAQGRKGGGVRDRWRERDGHLRAVGFVEFQLLKVSIGAGKGPQPNPLQSREIASRQPLRHGRKIPRPQA
jgi:hypothetical protein